MKDPAAMRRLCGLVACGRLQVDDGKALAEKMERRTARLFKPFTKTDEQEAAIKKHSETLGDG